TTCARFNGRPSRQQTHDLERALTPEQEQALKKHLLSIASWGFPLRVWQVRELVEQLAGRELGKCWVTRFIKRHDLAA
ncbi:hypothetical protein P154DRAFT_394942, partial [Amniculicola lignicola CBS 123094]